MKRDRLSPLQLAIAVLVLGLASLLADVLSARWIGTVVLAVGAILIGWWYFRA